MKVIIGLGNPSPKYSGTRHNVGFMVADVLAERWSVSVKSRFCDSKVGEGIVHHRPIYLVFPQTSMNASGQAVQCMMQRWKLEPSAFLVICDDISLPLGMIRLRASGSDGGHKGLASVLSEGQSDRIARLRVGIQTEELGDDVTAFVLGRFTASEKKLLRESVLSAADACEVWLTKGVSAAMNVFNRRVKCRI